MLGSIWRILRDVRKYLEDLLQRTTFFCFLLHVLFPASVALLNSAWYMELMFSFIVTHNAVVSPVHSGFVCWCFCDALQSSWAPIVLQAGIMAAGFSPGSPELHQSSLHVPSKVLPWLAVPKIFFSVWIFSKDLLTTEMLHRKQLNLFSYISVGLGWLPFQLRASTLRKLHGLLF